MSRPKLVEFSVETSCEIIQAYQKSLSKPRCAILCEKGVKRFCITKLDFAAPENLRKLCIALNKRFPHRRYTVIRIDELKITVVRKEK